MQVTACGWLLSILRAPMGTGIYPVGDKAETTITTSCDALSKNGLDGTLMDLLEIVHLSSIEDVLNHVGDLNFGARVRLRAGLKKLLSVFLKVRGKPDDSQVAEGAMSVNGRTALEVMV